MAKNKKQFMTPTLPNILHNSCFTVSPGLMVIPREKENKAYAKSLGVNKVYYIAGNVEVVNTHLLKALR